MKVVDQAHGETWALYQGDSAEVLAGLPDESVDLSVFSPPFSSLYAYTDSERDLGNCLSDDVFFRHFDYIIGHLLRLTKPGRVAAVHVADIPAMLVRDDYIGMKDFSGEVIRHFIAAGWVYDARIPIDKNQQAQSIRTHAKGLTFQSTERDRAWARPALPDYILKFRRPGKNAVPVQDGDVDRDTWIEWAAPTWPDERDRCAEGGGFPTWYGIRETDTLNVREARSDDDERHIAPLQLATIDRCIRLWSLRGETVLTPFLGIGSEVYLAVRLGRRGVGVELKPEYFAVAVKSVRRAMVEQAPMLAAIEAAV